MRNAKSRRRPNRAATGGMPLSDHARPTGGPFPPLTTTLKSFVKDGSDRAFRELIYTFVALANQMDNHLKMFATLIGVSEAQVVMLRVIAERQDATVGLLAQQLYVTSQFVTIEIGDMVKKGIVEKKPNEADRRSMFLRLTAKGESLLRELSAILRMANDIHFRSLTEERAKLLQEMLSAILTDGVAAYHEVSAPNLRSRAV
jgi:MarR family transcriptional regulator, organic hydroperoxide resistance regulator